MELKPAIVVEGIPHMVSDGDMLIYPSDEEMRAAALLDRGIIMLPRLADKKCKRCYGRGHLGVLRTADRAAGEYWREAGRAWCGCLTRAFAKEVREKMLEKKFAIER